MLRCFQCLSIGFLCGIDVRTYFPYDPQLYAVAGRVEIFEDDSGCHLWLSDIDRGYHSFLDFGARPVQLDADLCYSFICVGVYLVEVAESKDKAIPK